MFDGAVAGLTRPILVARTREGTKLLGVARGPIVGTSLHTRYYYDSAAGVVKNTVVSVEGVLDEVIRKSGLQDIVFYTPTEVTDITRSDVKLKLLSLYA